MEDTVRAGFLFQGKWGERLGSPLTALLCNTLGRKLDRDSAIGRRILDWPEGQDPIIDALALRLTGGLHALVRRGRLPGLATLYPPNPLPNEADLWAALSAALRDAEDELQPWLDGPPQTNEVARSALFMGGLLTIAAKTDLPFALYEVGCSGGLNLLLDHYAYRFGSVRAGRQDSPVELSPTWQGCAPPQAAVRIVRRRGVDIAPLDVKNADSRAKLLAYIWPDQSERLQRMHAALDIAMMDPPIIDQGDAADWMESRLDPAPEPGVVRVLMHSIAFQYFPAETQRRIMTHLDKLGAQATPSAPVAWLRFEVDPNNKGIPTLRLTRWPDGSEQALAVSDGHCRNVKWLA
jgi:hypothetical protein